jgi:hypothetical protein
VNYRRNAGDLFDGHVRVDVRAEARDTAVATMAKIQVVLGVILRSFSTTSSRTMAVLKVTFVFMSARPRLSINHQ